MNNPIPCDTEIPATLFQGDQLLSTGRAILITSERRGLFWPEDEIRPDIPNHGVHLMLSGKEDAIALIEIHQCTEISPNLHYHFDMA
jgi:hypothetical protein